MNLNFLRTTNGISEACERVRASVLFILDSIRKDRHYLNKHFQQAMSAYFLRNLCFPLLAEDIEETSSSKMHMNFAKKYSREEGSDYLRLMNGYALEISNYGKQDMYRKKLVERVLLVFEDEEPLENLTVNKKLSGKIWFRAFSLFLLFHSYNPRVEGILEIWTALFPQDPIHRCRKQNINHTIPIRGLTQTKYLQKIKTEKIAKCRKSQTQKQPCSQSSIVPTQKAISQQSSQEQFVEKEFAVQQRPQITQIELVPHSSLDSNISTGNKILFIENNSEFQRNELEKVNEKRQSFTKTTNIELTKQTHQNFKESNSCQAIKNIEMHTLFKQQPQIQSQFPQQSKDFQQQCLINPLQKQHSFLQNVTQRDIIIQPPEQQQQPNLHCELLQINQPQQLDYPQLQTRYNQQQKQQSIQQERPSSTLSQMPFENSLNNLRSPIIHSNISLFSTTPHQQPQKIVSKEMQNKLNPFESHRTDQHNNQCLIPVSSNLPESSSQAESHSNQLISSQQLLLASSFQQISQQFKEQQHPQHEQQQCYQQQLEQKQCSSSSTNVQNNEYLWDPQLPSLQVNICGQQAVLNNKNSSQFLQIQQQPIIENSSQQFFYDYNQNQSCKANMQGQYHQQEEQPLFVNRSSRVQTQSQIFQNEQYLD